MLLRLVYLCVTNVFALLRLLAASDRDKGMEILLLRHQVSAQVGGHAQGVVDHHHPWPGRAARGHGQVGRHGPAGPADRHRAHAPLLYPTSRSAHAGRVTATASRATPIPIPITSTVSQNAASRAIDSRQAPMVRAGQMPESPGTPTPPAPPA